MLEKLKESTPQESAVYFLLGQVYRSLGDQRRALMNFSTACDLDRGSNVIREAIDAMSAPQYGEDQYGSSLLDTD